MPVRPLVRTLFAGTLGVSLPLLGLDTSQARLVESSTPAAEPAPAPGPSQRALAAPAPPTVVSSGATTTNSGRYSLGTVDLTAGRLYVAFVTLSETGSAVDRTPGVVGGGASWQQVDSGEASALGMGLTAHYLRPTVDVPAAALRTGTLSRGHEGISYTVVEIGGAESATQPVAQYAAGNASPATGYTRTLPTAPAADSLVLGAFAHAANEGSSPRSGWTEAAGSDRRHGSPPRGAHVVFDGSAPDATAGSTWATSAARRGIVLEVPGAQAAATVTLAGAGDLCGSYCASTADRVVEVGPDAVVTMGDLAYNDGLMSQFLEKYGGGTDPQTRWGQPAIKDITLPGYGNHDCYDVPRDSGATKQGCDDAVAYFGPDSSFGTDIPGTPGSYYKVLGDWLVVHLNSAGQVGSGQATATEISAQNQALSDVLAADAHECEVVVWHHPRYSSGEHGNISYVDPWFETAYANGVDVVLNGHDHDYERFAPQNGDGVAVADGVRELVVGTGGAAPRAFGPVADNSLVRIFDMGILTMELRDGSYSWSFLDDLTGAVDDAGSDVCH